MATSARVTKKGVVASVANRTGLSRAVVSEVYEALVSEVVENVAAERTVLLSGFGRFYVQDRAGHPVQFGEGSESAGYRVLKFSASRFLNKRLGDPVE